MSSTEVSASAATRSRRAAARRRRPRVERLQRVPGAAVAVAPAVDPGVDQAVRVQTGRRAGRKQHGRLPRAGRHPHADRRRGAGRGGLEGGGAEHDRRRHARAGVGQAGRRAVVHGDRRARVVGSEMALEDLRADLERVARLEPALEVGAQHVADQRRDAERAPAGRGHAAHDQAQALLVEREHVVEVAARRTARGGAVGDGSRGRAPDLRRRLGKQRPLEEPDVLEQRLALASQAASAARQERRGAGGQQREGAQAGDQGPQEPGDDLDGPADAAHDGAGHGLGVARAARAGRGRCRRPSRSCPSVAAEADGAARAAREDSARRRAPSCRRGVRSLTGAPAVSDARGAWAAGTGAAGLVATGVAAGGVPTAAGAGAGAAGAEAPSGVEVTFRLAPTGVEAPRPPALCDLPAPPPFPGLASPGALAGLARVPALPGLPAALQASAPHRRSACRTCP